MIDSSWLNSQGYAPVRVTFRPIGTQTFPADRNLKIELRPSRWGSLLDTRVEVSREFTIPEGESEASVTLLWPQEYSYGALSPRIFEDGKLLKDISSKRPIQTGQAGFWWNGTTSVAIAYVSYESNSIHDRRTTSGGTRRVSQTAENDNSTGLRALARLTSMNQNRNNVPTGSWDSMHWMQIGTFVDTFDVMHPSDLPETLPGLSALDLVLINHSDLERMSSVHPPQLDVLRRWLKAGGNLCVTSGTDDFSTTADIEGWLDLEPLEIAAPQESFTATSSLFYGEAEPRWRYPSAKRSRTLLSNFRQNTADISSVLDKLMKQRPDTGQTNFIIRRAQLGQVVLVKGAAFQQDMIDWNLILVTIPDRMWDWETRQGMSLETANDGYWDFMIPGVGLPPVTAFQVLITIFAMLIGPLNYALLSRRRKLGWLLASVPLGALVTILGLLVFAMFTDGISVRSRIRSLTHIDHRAQHAVSMSRQSYYAGIAPGKGLQYPEDATVMPIDHTGFTSNGIATKRRVIEHVGDTVRYRVAHLPSRTTVQYYVNQSKATEANLSIGAVDPPEVSNQLGTGIQAILYRDADGDFFIADKIADQATGALRSLPIEQVKEWLTERMGEDRLRAPLGLDQQTLEDGLLSQNNWRRRSIRMRNRSSIFERTMSDIKNGLAERFPKSAYLALVEEAVEVPVGVDKPLVRQSLHFVMGQF